MNYGLGSDDPDELAYYKKLRKEMYKIEKDAVKKGIPLIGIPRWNRLMNQIDSKIIIRQKKDPCEPR